MIDWLMNVYMGSLLVTALHGLAPVGTVLPHIAHNINISNPFCTYN